MHRTHTALPCASRSCLTILRPYTILTRDFKPFHISGVPVATLVRSHYSGKPVPLFRPRYEMCLLSTGALVIAWYDYILSLCVYMCGFLCGCDCCRCSCTPQTVAYLVTCNAGMAQILAWYYSTSTFYLFMGLDFQSY
jgi:hypothetical protein